MEEPQKMVLLKKAYADIILNTAKEAAARVMVSEQKSLRFQQDLLSTKESAALMLLRLKQMIDAKINEANNASSSRQKRIEELEAELNETEGTVIGLREEIKQARDQLDEVKSNNNMLFNGQIQEKGLLSCENTDNFSLGDRNLASVITKRNDLDSYRNELTQRIRAVETNLGDENLLSENVSNQQFVEKGQSIIKENVLQVNVKSNSAVKLYKKQRRKRRYGKAKAKPRASSCRFHSNEQMKPRKLPSKNISNASEKTNVAESNSGLQEKLPNKNDESVCYLRRSVRKRKLRYRGDDFATSCSSTRKSDGNNSRLVTSKTKNTGFSNLDSNDKVDNESSTGFDAKMSKFTSEAQCEDENKRLVNVKYRFSRKRKRESVTKPDENSSVVNESSSYNRRLVQVANQLISLSGKRWP